MDEEVRNAIEEILTELGIEPESITDPAVLGRELGLDSTDSVEVSLELKRRFGVDVKVQVRGEETVADLRSMVTSAISP
jgi:acyl carrier protein